MSRRALIADAAISTLASDGMRGLTHRAVDAQAAEPPGTTSRYFRTREALTDAVVERVRTLRDHGRATKYEHDEIGWCSRLDGLQATRSILGGGDGPRVLMLTTFDLDEYVYAAL